MHIAQYEFHLRDNICLDLTTKCSMKATKTKKVQKWECKMIPMAYYNLWNEMKWKSVICEMEIC